jgi:NAD(P)-dependent dehydrogenase (short-subunit alcohol dehydrogenase family)
MTVHGKVAVVTGAGTGIGRTIARLFSKAGTRVVIADINQSAGLDACDEIVRLGGEACFLEADVTKPEDVTDLFRRTIA